MRLVELEAMSEKKSNGDTACAVGNRYLGERSGRHKHIQECRIVENKVALEKFMRRGHPTESNTAKED